MICYKDMTFCAFYWRCEEGDDCPRALTKEVTLKADGIGLPICQFMERPECFKEAKHG